MNVRHAFLLASLHLGIGVVTGTLACGATHTSGPSAPASVPATTTTTAPANPSGSATGAQQPSATNATGAQQPSVTNAKAPNALQAGVSTSKVHREGQHYALDAQAPSAVGKAGTAEVDLLLSAKDGYHLNDAYPYKLRVTASEPDVISFERIEFTLAESTRTKTEAHYKIRFQGGAREGATTVALLMALSVCTSKECITDKVQLELPVRVK